MYWVRFNVIEIYISLIKITIKKIPNSMQLYYDVSHNPCNAGPSTNHVLAHQKLLFGRSIG